MLFVSFFSNVGQDQADKIGESVKKPEDYFKHSIKNSIYLAPVTEKEVLKITNSLKTKFSSGYDNISTYQLKMLIPALLNPLSYLINRCLQEGEFPSCLKIAKIVPLYKGNEKNLLNNYRPISLLSGFSKFSKK